MWISLFTATFYFDKFRLGPVWRERNCKTGKIYEVSVRSSCLFHLQASLFWRNTSSPSFAHLRDFKGQFFFFFIRRVGGICLYADCSPAPGRAQRMEASPTFVTLLPCHASPTRAPSLRIALQAHRTWTRQQGKRRGKKKSGWNSIRIHKRLNSINISLFSLQG